MFTMKGKYNTANIFIDSVDPATLNQIQGMLNHPAFAGTYIAIMPDTHAGKGSVVGFTMTMNEYIIPNIIGVDIGCGIEGVNLGSQNIDFEALDNFIKKNVPHGFHIHAKDIGYQYEFEGLNQVVKKLNLDTSKVYNSLGTLGGGNHFIEVDKDPSGNYWLVIHSGSRNFGMKVAQFYQDKAKGLMKTMFVGADAYKDLEYLPLNHGGEEYLADMSIAQQFAQRNRDTMFNIILEGFFKMPNHKILEKVSSVHNYINFDDKIIRKGAIQANEGQRVIIPFNMRDGVAIATGKGSKKYNFSAPHGAGRILSRKKAKETLSEEEFKATMEGIYTTTANRSTLDESPMAYKDMNLILENINDTVGVDFLMKPCYNFKASE